MVRLEDIQKDVRIVLDHNEVQASLAELGEDQLQLDAIIENQVEVAARTVMLMSPRSYINWQVLSAGAGSAATGNAYYVIPLPTDFLRFGAAKMGDWKRGVDTYYNMHDPEYSMQQSDFAGVRATRRKPAAFICEKAEGGSEVQLYPCTSGDELEYMTYCKQPKLVEGKIDITETLYQPFIYTTAAFVAEVLKDTDKNNELLSCAKTLLTNPDEVVAQAPTEG